MAVELNLCGNDRLVPPGGYPFRLWVGGQTIAQGVVPLSTATVTAKVYAESGTADVHMAIYAMPSMTTPGSGVIDPDGALVVDLDEDDETIVIKTYQADTLLVGKDEATLTLTMPTNRSARPYIVRLWADNITGAVTESEDRDGDASVADEVVLPTGIYITDVSVS